MGTLFISFLIAIGGAASLVMMSKTLNLDDYTTRVFPLIPILYAIIYETIAKRRTGKINPTLLSQSKGEMKAGSATFFRSISVGKIAVDVVVAFLVKFALEIMLTMIRLALSRETFTRIYGNFDIATVGRILWGNHPWLGESQGIVLLSLIALATSLGTGLWIGNTTKANPILEGVLTGTVVTFITTLTNMSILYRQFAQLADETIQSFGSVPHIGFIVVLSFQVMLYGLWSGIAQRSKIKREVLAAAKKRRRS